MYTTIRIFLLDGGIQNKSTCQLDRSKPSNRPTAIASDEKTNASLLISLEQPTIERNRRLNRIHLAQWRILARADIASPQSLSGSLLTDTANSWFHKPVGYTSACHLCGSKHITEYCTNPQEHLTSPSLVIAHSAFPMNRSFEYLWPICIQTRHSLNKIISMKKNFQQMDDIWEGKGGLVKKGGHPRDKNRKISKQTSFSENTFLGQI